VTAKKRRRGQKETKSSNAEQSLFVKLLGTGGRTGTNGENLSGTLAKRKRRREIIFFRERKRQVLSEGHRKKR